MSSSASPNYHIGKVNKAKRAEIPFTIVGDGTVGNITGTIDDEFKDSAEIFLAILTSTGKDGALGGNGGAAASVLDPSANDSNSKAFPALLSSDTAPCAVGFIVADGQSDYQPSTIPVPNDGSNPAYPASTTQVVGTARKLYHAEAIITEGSTGAAGVLGYALRAKILTAGITPKGNVKVVITFDSYFKVDDSAADAANTFKFNTAGTYKGILKLVYL